MKKMITGHMIVKNEDRFIWYAISSVLPYVDKLLIFDTGSDDQTVAIIKSFGDRKIYFQQIDRQDSAGITKLRNLQIKMTKTPWIWIIDGDEVYPRKTIKSIVSHINDCNIIGIIVNRYNLLGDIYHCQDESVGVYNQFGIKGHYALRLINKNRVSGLQVKGLYPQEFYADKWGISIKGEGKQKFVFVKERIFHAMYLQRSTKINQSKTLNRKKMKIESGYKINISELPEVFFYPKPSFVPDVTQNVDFKYQLKAALITPIKKIKRKILG